MFQIHKYRNGFYKTGGKKKNRNTHFFGLSLKQGVALVKLFIIIIYIAIGVKVRRLAHQFGKILEKIKTSQTWGELRDPTFERLQHLKLHFTWILVWVFNLSSPKAERASRARAVTVSQCPHSEVGQDFLLRWRFPLTETAVTRKRKVEKSIRRCQIDCLATNGPSTRSGVL